MKKILLSTILLGSIGLAAASNMVVHEVSISPEIASNVIVVQNPAVMGERVNQNTTEVYMNLDNNGNNTHEVVAATSPAAEIVQLHVMYEKNGQMYMHRVPAISVNPHSVEPLKDGSFHVMLIDTKKQLTAGQVVPVTLIFEDGSWIKVSAIVK